jgi:hypothetical protein
MTEYSAILYALTWNLTSLPDGDVGSSVMTNRLIVGSFLTAKECTSVSMLPSAPSFLKIAKLVNVQPPLSSGSLQEIPTEVSFTESSTG